MFKYVPTCFSYPGSLALFEWTSIPFTAAASNLSLQGCSDHLARNARAGQGAQVFRLQGFVPARVELCAPWQFSRTSIMT